MDTMRFVQIATSLSRALSELHQNGVVHQGICPSRVSIDYESAEARIASPPLPPGEIRSAASLLAESPAYMAPEQTGRLGLAVDPRTDLYSLGALLYDIAAGAPPFEASGTMQWIHCHVARAPRPLADAAPTVPEQISAIIMKLLAKRPEDRYQSAEGLLADLERGLDELEREGSISSFPLGEREGKGRLRLPDRFYGREKERAALLDAFHRVKNRAKPELVLVSGEAGIGKSMLVQDLSWPIAEGHGLFASGGFSAELGNASYSGLVPALREVVLRILTSSEVELDDWRHRLTDALGDDGQIVIDIIPEIEFIVGRIPESEAPRSSDTRRFQQIVQRFLLAVARAEHPLCLFLDDLPKADVASLKLLEYVLSHPDTRYLLVIGTGRSSDFDAHATWENVADAMEKAGVRTTRISLAPLSYSQLELLVADTLSTTPEQARPLAAVVYDKTMGSPLTVGDELKALEHDGNLWFDATKGIWRWDISATNRNPTNGHSSASLLPKTEIASGETPLDVLAVIKAAQALSGELVLDKMLTSFMRIAVEHAGADRGYFLMTDVDGLHVAASANVGRDGIDITIDSPRDLDLASILAETIVHYVQRTREHVIVDDGPTSPRFAGDPFIICAKPKSILCIPMVRNVELRGLLYFENNLIPCAFTESRLALLELIATQATISLENAMLYEDLRRENEERRLAEVELQDKIRIIQEQQQAIRTLSVPIVEVWDGVLNLPLFGAIDSDRAALIQEALLGAIAQTRAQYAIIDLTGVAFVDTTTADHIFRLVRAVELLGARGIVVGIRPELARTFVSLHLDMSRLKTLSSLREALLFAMESDHEGARSQPSRWRLNMY